MANALHPDDLRAKRIATLQRYRREAAHNTLENIPGRHGRNGRNKNIYPPEVVAKRLEFLSSLCIKHKAKLEANRHRIYGILVATATRMALDYLGLRNSSRKGFYKLRAMNKLKVDLGLQAKNPSRRYHAKAPASLQERNLSLL